MTRCLLPLAAPALLLASLVSTLAAQPASTRAASARNSPERARGRATLAEYRGRVSAAVAPLEALATAYDEVRNSEQYEVWSKEGFNSDFVLKLPKKQEETFAKVRGLLPPREKVEAGGVAAEVDNSWVHEALDGLKSERDYEKAAASVRALAGRLRALEARLRESDASAPADLDRDAERGRLNSILRRPEFDRQAPRQQGALERMIEGFLEWLSNLFPKRARVAPGGSPLVSKGILALVIGLCLAVLVYVARRLWLRRGGGTKSLGLGRGARVVLGERLEADQTASDLLDEAERLARAGELRGAIRKAYVALLCELGDRGVVRLAQHKTNRDYLDAVRRAARPRLYTEMLPLTSDFELHWYGLRAASDADWQSFKTRCQSAVKEVGS
ncbi:MAG: hypothetical protein QOH49_2750 [Acidobacteriota bacterium]|nr:hypothetical protein [Acidobacteriota bacterium]